MIRDDRTDQPAAEPPEPDVRHFLEFVEWWEEKRRRADMLGPVVEAANNIIRRGLAAEIGPLTEVPRLQSDVSYARLQVRSQPLPQFGGAEFRFDVAHDAIAEPDALADAIVQAAWHFTVYRSAIADSAAIVRTITSHAIPGLQRHGLSFRPLTFGFRGQSAMLTCFDPVLEVEMLGHSLTPVIDRVIGNGLEDFDLQLRSMLDTHLRRVAMLAETQAIGAHGLVELPALRAIELAGLPPDFVIKRLARRNVLHFRYLPKEVSAMAKVYWNEGILKADLDSYETKIYLENGVLTVSRLLPKDVVAKRAGKRIGKLVKDPHIDEDTIVVSASRDSFETHFEIELEKVPFFV